MLFPIPPSAPTAGSLLVLTTRHERKRLFPPGTDAVANLKALGYEIEADENGTLAVDRLLFAGDSHLSPIFLADYLATRPRGRFLLRDLPEAIAAPLTREFKEMGVAFDATRTVELKFGVPVTLRTTTSSSPERRILLDPFSVEQTGMPGLTPPAPPSRDPRFSFNPTAAIGELKLIAADERTPSETLDLYDRLRPRMANMRASFHRLAGVRAAAYTNTALQWAERVLGSRSNEEASMDRLSGLQRLLLAGSTDATAEWSRFTIGAADVDAVMTGGGPGALSLHLFGPSGTTKAAEPKP